MRFCEQVMAGVPPEEICALTFTRAATREIFSAVIQRFISGDVKPFPGSLSVEEALKAILEVLPRLQIATIDSFSAKLARLFAYELGLNPDLTLYEEDSGAEWKEILREIVRRALRVTSQHSADELFSRFNLRGRGSSGTGDSVAERLRSFLDETKALLHAHSTGWGELPADALLPQRCTAREEKIATLLTYQETCQENPKNKTSVREKYAQLLEDYHAEVENLRHLYRLWGGKWKQAEKFAKLALEGTYQYGNSKAKVQLDGEGRAVVKALWDDLLARDLEQTAAHTRTLYAALAALDEASQAYLSETGKIGFSALTRTLAETIGDTNAHFSPQLATIAYRMDTAIRHLMIDEFQDTSTEQWAVLSNLAHELAATDEQSFFYVGDTKQSIYGWRGGDATLFGDTTRVPDVPAGKDLLVSYRSSPAVIAFVNQAMRFTAEDIAAAEPWQRGVLEAWRVRWKDHIAHRNDNGYAAWVTLDGKQQEVWLATLADVIAARWQDLSQRKVSIAVLAPKTRLLRGEGSTPGLLGLLRDRGVPCAMDGRIKVAETPMGQLVVRLLHWLSEPRATLWCEVAKRIGLAEHLTKETPNAWIRLINEEGFGAWLEACLGAETPLGKRLTSYDHDMLQAVRRGLEAVDARGEKEPLSAQRALESLEVPCSSNQSVVTLMTIHHSKGLTFDVVYTLLDDAFINEARVMYEAGADWVLEKPVLPEVYERVAPLAEARAVRNASRFRDGLCALYVAITRARREQIVFSPTGVLKGAKHRAGLLYPHFPASSETYRGIEGATLTFAQGEDAWWEDVAAQEPAPLVTQELPPWTCDKHKTLPEVDLPSEHAKTSTLEELLSAHAQQGAHYGTSWHERFATIAWTEAPPKGLFREVFRLPAEPCELWRERSFAVTLNEGTVPRYIAGQFDRVHLFPERRRAVIYDFKTTQTPGRTEAYDHQLREYRTALAALTGYAPEAIDAYLLFTHDGSVEEVPHV